jgi:hypothetical protein
MTTHSTPPEKNQEVPGSSWERVPNVWDFYDVPLGGIARFQGTVHLFVFHDEQQRPDPEDPEEVLYEEIYALYPLPEELVALLMEKSDIFERWHKAWSADQTLMKQHPALDADRDRYNELKAITAERLEAVKKAAPPLLKKGAFSRGRYPVEPGHSAWTSYGVKWSDYLPVETAEQG